MNNRIFARMENDYSKLATSYEVASLKYNQLYRDNETYLYTEGLSKLNPLKNKTSDVYKSQKTMKKILRSVMHKLLRSQILSRK